VKDVLLLYFSKDGGVDEDDDEQSFARYAHISLNVHVFIIIIGLH
jgi:hypothetical protein